MRFTVLPIGGTLPVAGSGLRLPAQATSKTFSNDWPFLLQPLMIWIRSRLAASGSFTAQSANVGALAFADGRSAPIGTPLAYAVLTQSFCFKTSGPNSQPPNSRTLMRTPLVE